MPSAATSSDGKRERRWSWARDGRMIADAFAAGATAAEVSERAGVSRQTAHRWRAMLDAPNTTTSKPSGSRRKNGDLHSRAHRAALGATPGAESSGAEDAPEPGGAEAPKLRATPELVASIARSAIITSPRVAAMAYRVPQSEVDALCELDKDDERALREHADLIIPWLNDAGTLTPKTGALCYLGIMLVMALPRVLVVRGMRPIKPKTPRRAESHDGAAASNGSAAPVTHDAPANGRPIEGEWPGDIDPPSVNRTPPEHHTPAELRAMSKARPAE